MDALKKSLASEAAAPKGKPRKAAAGQKEMLLPIAGKKIEETLKKQGTDAFLADDIKQAARERVFGFELMSAPYVIAHWQVGNFLTQLGAPLDVSEGERAAIYLTNSLTGWEPPKGPKANLPLFPELEQERDAAERVKRKVPILVVIGNTGNRNHCATGLSLVASQCRRHSVRCGNSGSRFVRSRASP
jgi:hypothetical protein